jgi:hypothetical protein
MVSLKACSSTASPLCLNSTAIIQLYCGRGVVRLLCMPLYCARHAIGHALMSDFMPRGTRSWYIDTSLKARALLSYLANSGLCCDIHEGRLLQLCKCTARLCHGELTQVNGMWWASHDSSAINPSRKIVWKINNQQVASLLIAASCQLQLNSWCSVILQ